MIAGATTLFFAIILIAPLAPAALPSTQPLTLAAHVRELPFDETGPFVQLKDGGLLCVKDDSARITHDDGKTWESRPLFGSNKLKARPEQALIRTRDGTIVFVFMDDLDKRWKWDRKNNTTDGEVWLHVWAIRSCDDGKSWVDLQMIQDGYCGAVRDMIQADNGNLIVTAQRYLIQGSHHAAAPFVSDDDGKTWKSAGVLDVGGRGDHAGSFEPTLVQLRDGRVWMLLRTNLDCFYQSYSEDRGISWGALSPTTIDASSSPGLVKRLSDGRLILLWNRVYAQGKTDVVRHGGTNSEVAASWFRDELSMAFSNDEGKSWTKPAVIARRPGSWLAYPYLLERSPGVLWITTMQGGLHVELNEADFAP